MYSCEWRSLLVAVVKSQSNCKIQVKISSRWIELIIANCCHLPRMLTLQCIFVGDCIPQMVVQLQRQPSEDLLHVRVRVQRTPCDDNADVLSGILVVYRRRLLVWCYSGNWTTWAASAGDAAEGSASLTDAMVKAADSRHRVKRL